MSHRRNLVPLAGALERLTRSVQPRNLLAEVQREWPEAVGETIAGWASPVSERGGVVIVKCDDSMIAHELEMLKNELTEKLAARISDGRKIELRFRV